jgi:hypothetical protein
MLITAEKHDTLIDFHARSLNSGPRYFRNVLYVVCTKIGFFFGDGCTDIFICDTLVPLFRISVIIFLSVTYQSSSSE